MIDILTIYRTLGTDSEMFDVDEDDEDMEAEPVGYVKLGM